VLVVTASGADSIAVSGACRSIVHACVAGLESTLPAASVARTRNVCAPAARPVRSTGEVQAENGAPSSEQS
jgi:hypothetical protein